MADLQIFVYDILGNPKRLIKGRKHYKPVSKMHLFKFSLAFKTLWTDIKYSTVLKHFDCKRAS